MKRRSKIFWLFPLLRIFVGLVFVVSGFEKLIVPWQNFYYVIESYRVFNSSFGAIVAHIFPWLEFFIGMFLVLGLWTPWAIRGAAVIIVGFLVVVGQALMRALPLDSCGCFGDALHIPPAVIFRFDIGMLIFCMVMLRYISDTSLMSLDYYFEKKED